jgi:hypothetical protein
MYAGMYWAYKLWSYTENTSSAVIIVNKSDSLSEVLIVFRRVTFRGGFGRKNLSKYNILQENDHAPPQVNW